VDKHIEIIQDTDHEKLMDKVNDFVNSNPDWIISSTLISPTGAEYNYVIYYTVILIRKNESEVKDENN